MKKTIIIAVFFLVLLVIAYFQLINNKNSDPRGGLYAGSATCAKCHSKLYSSYLHTAHYIASSPASVNTVHGSFSPGMNVFEISSSQKIVMEKRDGNLYQSYYLNGKVKESHRFDIAFGGVKGESYLYWKGNQLYQLPLSYYSGIHKWSTSPGYKFDQVNFGRPIGTRCLDCHASYVGEQPHEIKSLSKNIQQFDRNSLVYAVDCERCHGPAAQHAEFHTEFPEIKTARFIAKYSALPRARKLEICAICHSGKPALMLRSSFRFKPGDTLANFKMSDIEDNSANGNSLDVHGNQYQLLQTSKCFINSKMDCTTCHDTHQNQRGNAPLFILKCLNCHNEINHTYCKMANKLNAALIRSNCIKCHMPGLPTKVIRVQTADKEPNGPFLVHTHHIAIYPSEVKKVLAFIDK